MADDLTNSDGVVLLGEIQAASIAQSVQWFGEAFVITRELAESYNVATSEVTAPLLPLKQSVKGMVESKSYPNRGDGSADVEGREAAVLIGVTDADGNALTFKPAVGDEVESSSLKDSIREVKELRGSQGVTVFYRLVLKDG